MKCCNCHCMDCKINRICKEVCSGGGGQGKDGLSAYDVAVKNGYVGTEDEWLLSLIGESGAPGKQGEPGPQGIQGEKGIDGPQGVQGENGIDGASLHVLGSYDSYDDLIKDHPIGNPGDAWFADGYLYVWNESSQQWNNVGYLRGPQGVQGIQGIQGAQGIQGPKGDKGDSGETKLTGINAQAQSQMAKSVLSGSRVMLDTVIFNNSGIGFTGYGLTAPVGLYKIDWQVSFSNSASVPTTCSVYKDNEIYATASVSLQTGQLSGSTIMEVSAGTVDISIRNNTGANITLSSTPVQANITIIKIA